MQIRRVCLFGAFFLLWLGSGHAFCLPKAQLTIKVINEDGRPIELARVGIGFEKNTGWSTEEIPVIGFSDGGGFFTGSARVTDMETQLARIASMVRPGGRVMICNFQENYFLPLRDRFFERMSRYGVQEPPQTWRRIASEAGCRQLFTAAELNNIRIETKNVGYYLASADEWWDIVWNAGYRRLVSQLSAEDQLRFKREHVSEIGELRTDKGIWLDVGVLFTAGTRQ